MATTLEPRAVPPKLRQAQLGVTRRLARLRRRLRVHLLVEGVFWTLTAVLLAAAISLVVDRIWRFNLSTRQALLVLAGAAIVAVVVRRLVRPLSLPLADLDLAELVNRRAPGVGQQICNVLQLPELLKSERYASPALVEAAVAECAQSLDRVDLAATLNTPRRGKLLAICGAWVLLTVGFWLLWPATAELWARRWLAGSKVRWPQNTYLTVVGLGDDTTLLVPRGETSLLQIGAQSDFASTEGGWRLEGRGEPLVVESVEAPQSRSPEQVTIAYALKDGTKKQGSAVQFDEVSFRYEMPPLADPAQLTITGGDDWLGPITIEPVDRPGVSSLEITAQVLGSSEPKTETVGEGTSQFLFLPQTRIELRLVADQPLESADVSNGGAPVAGWQRADDRTYTLSWTMTESMALEFRLVGERGRLTSKPYFLAIGLLKDREPRLTIRSSGVGRRITPVARIPLAVRATDDFGVVSFGLELEKTQVHDDKPEVTGDRLDLAKDLAPSPEGPPAASTPAAAPPAAPPRTDIDLNYELELRERMLAPGNLLKMRALATDNCALGTQSGSSRWLSFQIVSADELFYEILMRQREQRAKFNAAFESAKAQNVALAGLSKQDEAIAVARAENVISRQVWQVANQLDVSLQEMTLNDLGNPQAREMLQSGIITPMRALHSELLTNLRAAVDELARQPTVSEERREEAEKLSQQAVDAMQNILAQMAQWESFVDVINQLKQIIQRQDEVLKTTEDLKKKRTDALFDE